MPPWLLASAMVANEWRWLATGCGHSKMHGVGKAICANVVHSAAVRCCSINGDRCVSVCGQEHPSLYTSNASTAYAACATRGLRLCTRAELLKKNLCCKNGCQSDARPVWTGETCAPADDCTDASFCQAECARSCGAVEAPAGREPILREHGAQPQNRAILALTRRSAPTPSPSPAWAVWGAAKPCVGIENLGGFGSVGLGNVKKACGLTQRGPGCTVVSVGSNNEWDFESEVVRRTCCNVEVFDCTMAPHVQPPVHLRSRVRLHRTCVSGEATPGLQSGGKEAPAFLPWQPLLKLAGLSKAPDYLKLDAEGFEWTFLPSLLASPEELLPKQIALEVHLWTLPLREQLQRGGFTPIPFRNASATVSEVASLVNPLWAKGYRLQTIDYNNPRRIPNPCCAELLLVRE